MSVSLLVVYGDKESTMTPVATQSLYHDYWTPAGLELNLEWIPQFEWGTRFRREDIPKILDELEQLRNYFTIKLEQGVNSDIILHCIQRLDNLVIALKEAQPTAFKRISIG